MTTSTKKNILLLTFGRLVSMFGTGVQGIAVPLYILEVTGKASMMALFSLSTLIPALIAAPFAGVIGDHFNRKAIMVITDALRFLLIGLLAIFAFTHSLVLWMLFVVQIFVAISDSLFNSSTDGILPDLAGSEHLHQANAAKGSTDAISMILGPVTGGVLYGVGGIFPVFLINALSFALSGLLEMMINYKKTTATQAKLTPVAFVQQIRHTLLFIWDRTSVRFLFLMGMILYFLFYPLFDIVFPYVVKRTFGFSSAQLGIFFAFLMGGVLGGNILTGKMFQTAGSGRLMHTGVLFETGLILLVGAISLPVMRELLGGTGIGLMSMLCILLFFIGFFSAWVLIPVQVNLQTLVPNDMRSKFYSMLNFFSQIAVPMGAMIYGILLDTMQSHYIIFGVGILFAGLAFSFLSKMKLEFYYSKNDE